MNARSPSPSLYIILSIVVFVAGSGLSYWQYQRVQEVRTKMSSMKKEISSKDELEKELTRSEDLLSAGIRELEHLESSVTTIEYIPTLLKDLQITGESCNLHIIGVRPVPTQQKSRSGKEAKSKRKPYAELDVQVKCRGSFENVMTFLKKLEDFPKIVGVRHVSVEPKFSARENQLDAIVATVGIRVYVFPPSKTDESSEEVAQSMEPVGGQS